MEPVWREGVFECTAGGRTILLDLHAGRYSALSRAAAEALASTRRTGRLGAGARDVLAPLLEDGRLLMVPGGTCVRPPPGPPVAELPQAEVRVAWRDVLWAAVAQFMARAALRSFGLSGMHRFLSRRRFDASGRDELPDEAALRRMATAMARTEILFSRHDSCLSRSLAFRLLALWHCIDVRMVLGVRSGPFGAHCWIERQGVVLNDDLDVVKPFSPILAI